MYKLFSSRKTSLFAGLAGLGSALSAGAQPPKAPAAPATTSPAVAAPAMGQPIGQPASPAVQPMAGTAMYTLDSFGPIATNADATATYQKALDKIQAMGGGVLMIPGSTAAGWRFSNNSQGMTRTPAAPAPAKSWGVTTGVTVIDTRGGTIKFHPPQVSGLEMSRNFKLPAGQSAPHWTLYPMLALNNNVVRGSTSYRDFLQEDVQAGADRRFYVATIRGIFPGMFLNGYGTKGVIRLYVKSLGYDPQKKMQYFVADTDSDHKKGAILDNKTHVNVMRMVTNAHTELQTFDMLNERHHYSQGDSYLYDASFHYMGNVHSTGGDENGVLYAAFTYSETNIFRGAVDHLTPGTDEVVFKGGANAHTLGSGRPLINLNPKKSITAGTVMIVRPGSFTETPEDSPWDKDPVFGGHTYPTTLAANPHTGIKELSMGGLIRGSADAPWTPDIVGRYFAVDDPTEKVGKQVRRWYLITALTTNADGTKDIKIERHWWGAKQAGSPTLYKEDNYSSDGHLKPLKYIIAPGANVYDVSGGVLNERNETYDGLPTPHTLLVAPYADRGAAFDFAPDDPIEQAIGPDPFKPIPLRAWTFDEVPGSFPAPIFDVANHGVPRAAVMTVAGDSDGAPSFGSVLNVSAHVRNVIDINGAIDGAAIHIAQPNKSAPIKWSYDGGKKEASLTVDNQTGKLSYDGGPIMASGGFTTMGGLSGTDVEAHNLRGIAVAVPTGVKSFFVAFPKAEVDENYAVFLETTWLGQRAITERKPDGFTVTFAEPTPANAKLDWTLVR